MKVKKRKKSSRFKGTRLNSRGYKNRTKGSGNRGGYGMAGTGKRGDQRKTLVLNQYGNKYFGKDLSTSKNNQIPSISVRALTESIAGLVKKGKAKQTKDGYEIELKDHKIVGNTKTNLKMKIHARMASEGAKKSVKDAGGEIVLTNI